MSAPEDLPVTGNWQPEPEARVPQDRRSSNDSNVPPPLPVRTIDFASRPPVRDDAADQKQLPRIIGRYRVEKLLGEGGFGVVYLAHDDELKRHVAVKVPQAERIAQPEDAEAYLVEAQILATLDHPHIVPVYDVGRSENGLPFVVSKFIEGSNLAERIKAAHLSIRESVALVARMAEALKYAHEHRLVHRDVKPGNILIDTSDKPFLVDFGLALKEEDFGKGGGLAGTPAYMSPEQAKCEGHLVDGRSDIFSLSVVLYELLTGQRPFKADNLDLLLDQIISAEACPPRQLDPAIPKELERITLKALAKRASERYATALDFADDLQHWLEPHAVAETGPASLRVIPKGLRSFDAHDADFFLELLPGPRDREGLPDTLRFWKTQIEESDADKTFRVGMIYGPSGCGKSSFVKAGLLPRLANTVRAVYVEATPEDTETRLLRGLEKACPDVPRDLSLRAAIAHLRRDERQRHKVLLVVDQFEQWLHGSHNQENAELVQALRQCDGERVQCVVMVRDDFWLAVSRFMKDLEIRVLEGHNSALVDLFDLRHAQKVLTAFGMAYGTLPENGELTRDQATFLEQAVTGLSQEGKVISVRLALFAEMVKGKPWTPATLKAMGGTEGVGVTFLEETFSATTAPPEHRYHQRAARAVLQALLPDQGTDIKGQMRSQQELLEASGYGSRPKDFDDLLRILDGELRLITPTDPAGKESEPDAAGRDRPTLADAAGSERYYQLTHDYLVPALRDWLTRKQKETRRGRAELLLADRAAVWNARPENRQLPSLLQWLNIRWWTQQKNQTPPQRKMMAKAGWYHAVRTAAVGVLLTIATITGLVIQAQVVEQRKEAAEQQKATHAAGLVQAVLNAETAQAPDIIGKMAEYRKWVDPLLRQENDKAAASSRQKLHASLALLPVDSTQVAYLYGRLLDAEPHEVLVLRDALAAHKAELQDKLWAVALTPEKDKEAQRLRAAAALAQYDPESEKWTKANALVVNDLVQENAVFLGQWSTAFRPVKERLLSPLSDIFRERQAERAAERKLATNLLADYAAAQPQVLTELLLEADVQQFAVLYRQVKDEKHGDRCVSRLLAEIDKQAVAVKDKMIFETKGTLAVDAARVKTAGGTLPCQRFEVPLQGGKRYRLTLDSGEFDTFLVLQDKSGQELAFDDDGGGDLNSMLVFVPAKTDSYTVVAASYKGTGSFVLKIVETRGGDDAKDDGKEKLAKRQANAAVALLKLGRGEKVWPLLKHSPDPRVRSYLIDRMGPLGVDAGALIKRLDQEQEPDVTIRRALLQSLGAYGEKLAPAVRQAVVAKVQGMYRTEADPGVHASSEWLLRTWKEEAWLKQVNEEWAKDRVQREKQVEGIKNQLAKDKGKYPPQWYVTSQGQTMVVIPGPVEFLMGSPRTEADRSDLELQHKRRIGRTFALSAKSVTREQFLRFNAKFNHGEMRRYPTPTCPIGGVIWYEAARYCNWLSKEEGIDEDQWCYEIKGQVTKLRKDYLSLTGYRLPTEAEMEYATRAGAVTSRYYGEADELLAKYAWYQKNSQERTWPVGSLKPNDLGLFDMQGNMYTWCQESFEAYPTGKDGEAFQDQEDGLVVDSAGLRVLRGGAFNSHAPYVRSASRSNNVPSLRAFNSFGVRPARTLPLVPFTALLPDPRSNPGPTILLDKKESLTDKDSRWMPTNPKGDPLLKLVSGNPHKVYTLNLMKGDKLVIRLRSKDQKIDPLVTLEDSGKTVIAYNDDEDYKQKILDSKLVVTIPADGEYRIIATCSHEIIRNKHGEFHLTVEKTK